MIHIGRNLAWWVQDYAYAVFWQLRAFANRTDPESFATGSKAPVVILPGIYETWKFMQPTIKELHHRGHPVHVVPMLRRNRRPVTEGAGYVADFLAERDLSDVVIVAHSKGGLIGKHVMAFGDATDRVRSMLAVATPFGGSRYGQVMVMPSLRAFSAGDPTIRALHAAKEVDPRIVSVFARFDPHIPEGSQLAGAQNVELDTGGHFRVLAHPRVIAEAAILAERSD